jgi:hypothetical protein
MTDYIDYSTWRPSIKVLKDNGVKAVGRYIGWDGQPGYQDIGKNITPAEASRLHSNNIAVWLAFEYSPSAPALGWVQGIADGKLAMEQTEQLKVPPGRTVYFAADWDVPDYAPSSGNAHKKLGPVAEYFEAIASLKPDYEIGIYGGYWPVSRAITAGLVKHGWQTDAWSGGNFDRRCSIHQYAGQIFEGNADRNSVLVQDFGQWPGPAVKPKTKIVLAHQVITGAETMHQFITQHPHNAVSTILRVTAENSPHGLFTGGMGKYIDVGDWDAALPEGATVYFYKEVPA